MAQQQSFFHHRLHLTMIWQKHRPKQGVTNFQKNKNICVCLCVTRFRRPHRHQIAVKYGGKFVEWKLPKILQLLQIQIIICLIKNLETSTKHFHYQTFCSMVRTCMYVLQNVMHIIYTVSIQLAVM